MKRFILLYFLIRLCSGILAQNPYWEIAPGPYGGDITPFPTNGNKVYALRNDGLSFRSDDYGEHWTPMSVTVVNPQLYSDGTGGDLYIGRSGIFYSNIRKEVAGVWIRELSRSYDEGITWQLMNDQMDLIQIVETPSGALVGRDSSYHIYRSPDGGLNWQNVSDLGVNLFVSRLKFVEGQQGKLILADNRAHLIYSTNDGQTWNMGGISPPKYSDVYLTHSGTILRVESPYDDLFRSTNWGASWTPVDIPTGPNGPYKFINSINSLANGRLILASYDHLYFSDNDGISWSVLPSSAEKVSYIFPETPLSNGDLIGVGKGGAFRSSDGGTTWSFSAYGIHLGLVSQMALLTDSLQMAVTLDGLWRTDDAGSSWTRILADTSVNDFMGLPDNHALALWNADTFAVSFGLKAWLTHNSGQSFSEITPPNGMHDDYLCAGQGGVLFANDTLGILLSHDFGLSWLHILDDRKLLEMCRHPNGTFFVLSRAFSYDKWMIHRSTDGGATWQILPIPDLPLFSRLYDMVITPDGELYVAGYSFQTQQNYLVRSLDLGETWHAESIPYPYWGGPLALNAYKHLFTTASPSMNIFTSVDEARSWYTLPPFDRYLQFLCGLEISPSGHLYALSFYEPVYRSNQSTLTGGYIKGHVLRDADADCSTPDAQAPLKNWIVKVNGEHEYAVNTSESGSYSIFTDPGTYEISAQGPQSLWWTVCDSLLTVQLDSAGMVDSIDFAGVPISECPLMSVDITVPQLRRCFNNNVYVAYCNSGSEAADSAWVDIELDPFLSLVSSVQTHDYLGNNTYRFQLGDIDWGECGQFSFVVYVDCESTVLGQTHCISAHAFPDTLCSAVPEWSGANIEAQANCQDSLVQLRLQNTGTNPSTTLNYIIIEDDVVLLQGQKQYEIGESVTLDYAANGSTWRIESQQEPGHPFSNLALAFLEGCGGFESLGFINRFSINGWEPSTERSCVENTGSYDPNDKQGFPLGYGTDNRIRPGQALEYIIRFQNTGTDTAFTVQIRDTLSAWLDPATLRPSAASHPYTWSLSGPGVLTFRFDHILLPDSNVNLIGSQGFVSFKIDQRPGVPLETQILNSAAIYFDFNEPVITNQTLHTVGIDYITSVQDVETSAPSIGIQPNPALNETLLRLPEGTERLTLTDVLGRSLRILQVQGPIWRLERGELPSGMYWLRAEDLKGNVTGVGKVVWR